MRQPKTINNTKFKYCLDNSKITTNTLTKEDHLNCHNLLKEIKKYPIRNHNALFLIDSLSDLYLSQFSFNSPVDWHSKRWSKTSYDSDEYLSLLQALDKDYSFISDEPLRYTQFYGIKYK